LKSNLSDPGSYDQALEKARPRLGRLGAPFSFFPTIGSTNDAAALLAEGAVVVADQQTAGRGRRGHAWFSPPASGLYVSVVLAPRLATVDPLRATQLVTLGAGVAIAEALETAAGLQADLKWPNDLYVGGRKLAGILAESSGDTVILGYGINVAPSAFPPELRDRVTSIESELGRGVDRHQLFAETLAALSRRYEDLLSGRFDAILDAWRRRAPAAVGARVSRTVDGAVERGVTEGIDDRGALLVRVGDRTERIVSGEITWL
jgi:BirA family transcriptional regulator, biotin operon repressor / biotin---[acetyl-CoA-carboxylase] ligase